MSDHDAPMRDRVVETALRLLPIPDHQPGFWDRLDARLAEEAPTRTAPPPAAPAVEEPADPDTAAVPIVALEPELRVIPAAMRRPSNLVLSALAVAAAVVVVVAGSALLRSRTGGEAPDEHADPKATALQAPEAADPEPPGPLVATDDPEAQVVVDWVQALAAGDVDTAWSLLGPGSQARWGSRDAFAAERTAFAEGYGAWAAGTADQVLVTPLVDGSLAVVTLVGVIDQEGARQARADAFPIRRVAGDLRVELHAEVGPVELVVPDDPAADGTPAAVERDAELVVVVPAGAGAPVLRVDDGPVVTCGTSPGTELTELEGGTGRRCGYRPGSLASGEHVLTVAVWTGDGSAVTARSVRFRVP